MAEERSRGPATKVTVLSRRKWASSFVGTRRKPSGSVDTVLVDDQRVGQGADLQQAIPVAAGAGEAGGFEAEDGPGLAESNLGDQELEAVAIHGGGTGAALVLIDDGDGRLGPTQILSPLHEVVLAGRAG